MKYWNLVVNLMFRNANLKLDCFWILNQKIDLIELIKGWFKKVKLRT